MHLDNKMHRPRRIVHVAWNGIENEGEIVKTLRIEQDFLEKQRTESPKN